MKYLSGKYLKPLKRIGLYLELSFLTAGMLGCGASGQLAKKDYDVPEEVVKELEEIQRTNDILKKENGGTEEQQREMKILMDKKDIQKMEIEDLLREVEREVKMAYESSIKKA